MIARSVVLRYLSAAVVTVLFAATQASAQEESCQGSKPSGGKWATSAELYLDRAEQNPDPETRRERYRQALDVLKEGFVEQAGNPRNYKLAGEAYIGLGDHEGADSVWTKAVELWSCYEGTIDTLRYNAWVRAFNIGVRYANSGDMERAIPAYKNAITIYEQLPQPMLQLASHYTQEALQSEDSTQRALQQQAIELFDSALTVIEESEALSDADRREYARAASFNLAQLLALQDRHTEAAEAYEHFLQINPGNVTAKSNLAVVLTMAADGAREEAEELEEGVAKDSLTARADSLQALANEQYTELLARDDLSADEYHNIGIGLSRVTLHAKAAEAFRKALDLEPYRPNSLQQLGQSLYFAQSYDTLKVVAETLVARYPYHLNNLAMLANAYRELDEPEEALATLERREALPFELINLEMSSNDGTVQISGAVNNRSLEPGTPIEVQFDLYDSAGAKTTSSTLSTPAPEQGVPTAFQTSVEVRVPISGFTYEVLQPAGSGPPDTDGGTQARGVWGWGGGRPRSAPPAPRSI